MGSTGRYRNQYNKRQGEGGRGVLRCDTEDDNVRVKAQEVERAAEMARSEGIKKEVGWSERSSYVSGCFYGWGLIGVGSAPLQYQYLGFYASFCLLHFRGLCRRDLYMHSSTCSSEEHYFVKHGLL